MIRPECEQYQSLLKAGALLRAGQSLSPPEHSALQAHLAGCTDCQALAQQMLSLDRLLRVGLHARWDAVPRPKRISAATIQSNLRRQNMTRTLKTLVGALAAFALVAAIFFTFRQMTPAAVDQKKIIEHPEQYLIRYEEVAVNTEYYAPTSFEGHPRPHYYRIDNTRLPQFFGREVTEKLLADTERLDGWEIEYQRLNADDPGAESISNWITIHQTPRGAQTAVKENARVFNDFYAAYTMDPLGPIKDLGDMARASKLVNAVAPGFERTTYQVDFAYQTVSVRVQVTDLSSRVSLDDAVKLARIVLGHLKE